MPTRNINLTEHLDQFVEENVSSGQYQNASEVVRDGLRLLAQRTEEDAQKLKALRRAAREGFAQIDHGAFTAVPAGELGDFVSAIGKRAARRTRSMK